MKNKIFARLSLLLVCIILGGCELLNINPSNEKIELSLNLSKTMYDINEPIEINVRIKNPGKKSVIISNWKESSIEIKSFKKDGKEAMTHASLIKFDDDFKTLLKEHLVELRPDSSLSFSWESWSNQVLGGESIRRTYYQSNDEHRIISYYVGEAGKYEMEVYYKYSGPSDLVPDIMLSSSNTVLLSFEVK